MNDIHELYFHWLVERAEGRHDQAFGRLCWMLHQVPFERRIGNDINRASEGANLRLFFIDDQHRLSHTAINELLELDCSWLEMLIALSEALDYLYEGGVKERFIELITNMGLKSVLLTKGVGRDVNPYDQFDQQLVDQATRRVDTNRFDADGVGGLFPLRKHGAPDQRGVEIWDQHSAYFRERLEGVVWTSTS